MPTHSEPAAFRLGQSWHPAPGPSVVTLATDVPVQSYAFPGWQFASPSLCPALDWSIARPRSVDVAIRAPKIDTRSFTFEEIPEPAIPPGAFGTVPQPAASTVHGATPGRPLTRIRPPGDVVKLEERLRYLLQPALESLMAERSLEFPFPPFPFQFEGTAFLYPRHAAVLADEMGLGKSMQAITAIRLLLRCGEIRNALVICPKPLVTNWQREFGQWAPEIPVLVIEGDHDKRAWQWHLPDVPVRLANYELVRSDAEVFREQDPQGRPKIHFDLIALDEAQRIKNRAGTTAETVRSIARGRRWALTGTPVENSPEDLVGIFEFLEPGLLSADMKPRALGRTISDYVLRRTKDQVLEDLPPKLIHDVPLDLTPEQHESYRLAEEDGVLRLAEMGPAVTIQHVFELVLRLKQICNFDPATEASSKLERLEVDLEEVAASGRKAIVFSQWVGTISRLSKHLQRFHPLEYHGKIPSAQRDGVISRFREDPNAHVILMSYGAGGVGLNLQFAGYVFLFDRWWNPAVEDQAINRAHRIGAAGPVTVNRFLILQTIEERIERVLQEKRDLFDTIFSDTEPQRPLGLTQEEIFGLFDLRSPAGPIDLAA
jgi:SNF2 family DNA or RNA helicase